MISNKWSRNGATLLTGIVAALGIGPVAVTAISDLLPGTPMSQAMTTTIVATVGGIVAMLLLLWCWRVPRDYRGEYSTGQILRIIGIALLLSGSGWIIANKIDGVNSSAWRDARTLLPSPGISGRTSVEERLHYSQLAADSDYKGGGDIAALPASWRVWLAGGSTELLLRVRQTGNGAEGLSCGDWSEVSVSAIRDKLSVKSVAVPVAELCEKWRRMEISLPRHVTEIRFNWSGDPDTRQIGRSLEISVLSMRPNYRFLWAISTIIATGVLLALAYVAIFGTKESARSVPDQAVTDSPARRKSGVAAVAGILLFLIASNAFVVWFVSQENTIYTWDTAGYWTSSRHVSEVLRGESSSASIGSGVPIARSSDQPTLSRDPLTSLVRNVRYSEYNVTNNLPVATAMVLFGGSRTVYVSSLTNIYALLCVLVLLLALRDLAKVPPSP